MLPALLIGQRETAAGRFSRTLHGHRLQQENLRGFTGEVAAAFLRWCDAKFLNIDIRSA
jgi:hypothetical protein